MKVQKVPLTLHEFKTFNMHYKYIYLTMILCNITIGYIPHTNLEPVKIIVAHFPIKIGYENRYYFFKDSLQFYIFRFNRPDLRKNFFNKVLSRKQEEESSTTEKPIETIKQEQASAQV